MIVKGTFCCPGPICFYRPAIVPTEVFTTGFSGIRPRINYTAFDARRVSDSLFGAKKVPENQLPANPVLSILQLIFHRGVDISDTSQLASILWRKSLQYVSTIPGCQSLYWAPVDDASPCQRIIVLIQWDSIQAWRLFQFSPGFSMMLGYIETIYNRCAQLALPANLFNLESVLELVSIEFSPPTAMVGAKVGFKHKWKTTFAPHVDTPDSGLIYCCGEWLEPDKKSEDPFFVGLLFWKPDQHRLGEANLQKLKEDSAMDPTNVVSAYTRQLNKISPETSSSLQQESDLLPDSVVQFETNHPVFKVPVIPQYSLEGDMAFGFTDGAHMDSVMQAKQNPPQRIACGPAGNWWTMGSISQHHLPRQLGIGSPDSGWHLTWQVIYFRGILANPHVFNLFELLRYKLWEILGPGPDSGQSWSRRREKDGPFDNVSLFIKVGQRHEEVETQIQLLVQEFSYGCGNAVQDLFRHRTHDPGELRRLSENKMDMTTFEVSENERDRASFTYAFSNYIDTTRQQYTRTSSTTPWDAVTVEGSDWFVDHGRFSSPDASEKTRATTVQYVSLFSHNKEGAGEEWYGDFAHRAQTEYDVLGHMVDWMRTLCKRVTIHSLSMEPEDPWVTGWRLSKQLPTLLTPQPPSIFDLPDGIKRNSME